MLRSTDSIEKTGVHAVGHFFSKQLGWIFREQPGPDFGIDAHVEVKEDGKATGQLSALQIKTGKSYLRKRGENFVYRGVERHLEYWLNHRLPVFILIHDPEEDVTYWQKIEESLCEVTEKGWSIEIPRENVLSKDSAAAFQAVRKRSDEETRREHLRLDLDLIEAVQKHLVKFAFMVDDNPIMGVTDLTVSYRKDDGSKKDIRWVSFGGGFETVHQVMQEQYWFLDWDYDDEVYRYDKAEEHVLAVHVRPELVGWLAVEKILVEGPPEIDEREIPYPEPTEEESFHDALEQDWEAELSYREDSRDG